MKINFIYNPRDFCIGIHWEKCWCGKRFYVQFPMIALRFAWFAKPEFRPIVPEILKHPEWKEK